MDETNIELAKIIDGRRNELSSSMILAMDVQPFDWWAEKIGQGIERKYWDASNHFMYLAEALRESDPDIFADYVRWLDQLMNGLNFPPETLPSMLEYTKKLLGKSCPAEMKSVIDTYVNFAISGLRTVDPDEKSYITKDNPLSELANDYLKALLAGDRSSAGKMVLESVESGVSVRSIYLEVFQPCQYEIGRLWHMNRVSVAQEHYCSAATQIIMSQLYPYIFSNEKIGRTFVGTCVGGELHEMGVRMVADFFEMAGWDTFYLGANTPSHSVIESIKTYDADVIGLSVAMFYHRSRAADLIMKIRKECADHKVKIMVGGYAFNGVAELWRKIGADGFASDARQAVDVANSLVSEASVTQ